MARRAQRHLVWIFDVPVPASTRLPWIACLERDGNTTRIYLSPQVPFEAVCIIWDQLSPDERLLWIGASVVPPPPDHRDNPGQAATP
jgi:hypothetical protein